MKTMPESLKRYFWDIDFSKLSYEKRPRFVIERILEFGDESAVIWMVKSFSLSQIISAFTKSRQLTWKSANFWALMFGIDRGKVKCLNKSSRVTQKQFWPY